MDNITRLLSVISKISEYQHPGKKALQKLIYLVERRGVSLGLDYCIHYYGPYSPALDHAVHSLEMQGAIEIIPDGLSQRIYMTDLSETLASGNGIKKLSDTEVEVINNVIEKFAGLSAFQLEVITTTDYVAKEIIKKESKYDANLIIAGVKTIKGDKFSTEQIKNALTLLTESGFLPNECL